MNKKTEGRAKVDSAANVRSCILHAKELLAKHILNADLFKVLNEDSAMESLLGRMVSPSEFDDPAACAKLRYEITSSLDESLCNVGNTMRESLECYVSDLTWAVQTYDARHESDYRLRSTFSQIAKSMSDEDKQKFASQVVDALCYTYSNAEAMLDTVAALTSFISDKCDVENLESIASTNGADMSDAQKSFLSELGSKVSEESFVKDDFFDVAMDDRLVGMTAEALGFTVEGTVKLIKKLDKVEGEYIKAVRTLRTAIVRPTATTEDLAVVNKQFYDIMDKFAHFIYDGSKSLNYLIEQLNLMTNTCVATPPKSKERSEDFEENNTGDDNIQTDDPEMTPITTD